MKKGMDSKLYRRWRQEMRTSDWFHAGERVGIAVSGGPDSMLLASFMAQLAGELGFIPAVLHFNHHLRGKPADEDEAFVAAEAAKLGLKFIRGEANVGRIAREGRRNLEATARQLRYQFFLDLIRRGTLDKVVTAHQTDDQAETVLLRLLRGTGARGLGGIHPVLDGKIFRPFLGITRSEIETEIRRRNISFRVDESNRNCRFTRNRIRNRLLPLLKSEFNPAIVDALAGFADRAREDEEYLEAQAEVHGREWRVREGGEERIPARKVAELPSPIARRVLRQMVEAASGGRHAASSIELEQLQRLSLPRRGAATLCLAGGLEALRDLDWIIVRKGRARPVPPDYDFPVRPPAEIDIPQAGLKFSFRTAENIERGRREWRYNNRETVLIDLEKVSGDLVLRNWREGDRFRISGHGRPAKLKRLFLARRVRRELRRSWPVLAAGEEVIWIRGFCPAEQVAASRATRRILVVEERRRELPGGERG